MIYLWRPKPDISAYELALCLHVLLGNRSEDVEKLPEEAQRHFAHHPDYDDEVYKHLVGAIYSELR